MSARPRVAGPAEVVAVKTVHKYPLDMSGRTVIAMPIDAEVVHVERQGNRYCIWAEHHVGSTTHDRVFGIFGTGHEIPDASIHLGSIQDGPFVFHIYHLLEKP